MFVRGHIGYAEAILECSPVKYYIPVLPSYQSSIEFLFTYMSMCQRTELTYTQVVFCNKIRQTYVKVQH